MSSVFVFYCLNALSGLIHATVFFTDYNYLQCSGQYERAIFFSSWNHSKVPFVLPALQFLFIWISLFSGSIIYMHFVICYATHVLRYICLSSSCTWRVLSDTQIGIGNVSPWTIHKFVLSCKFGSLMQKILKNMG